MLQLKKCLEKVLQGMGEPICESGKILSGTFNSDLLSELKEKLADDLDDVNECLVDDNCSNENLASLSS